MNDNEIEQKLIESGFTTEEIKFIQHWAEKEKSSWSIIIHNLGRYFIGGLFSRAIMIIFLIASSFHENKDYLYTAIIACVFGFIVMEVLAPLKIGSKTFFFSRKNNL